jgi:hypothetical protein
MPSKQQQLSVEITLDTRPYDEKYGTSRSGNGLQGPLEAAIAHIDEQITIEALDLYNGHGYNGNDSAANIAHIIGTTDKTLTALTVALYSNLNVRSRIKRLKTNADILQLSTRPQQHVPTESEIRAHNELRCTADKCPIHDY